MLSEITLLDFKCFENEAFSAAPLTVLTGTNSVGKSTVLQALCLMRTACLKKNVEGFVSLNGPHGLNLGQFDDVVRHNLDSDSDDVLIVVQEDQVEYTLALSGSGSRYAAFRFFNGLIPPGLSTEGLGQFVFLASDRSGPRNSLPIQSLPKDQLQIDSKGELVADILFQCERDEVRKTLEHPSIPGQRFLKQAEAWLSTFVPGVEIRVDPANEMDLAALRFMRGNVSSEWERPSNTGFGVSYCLPIIVAGLSAKPNSVLLVESPEAHMHPSAQSSMGSFLARIAASGVQVFIETHSDHVLNGIRKSVLDDAHPISREDVIIHHLFVADNGTNKEEIRIEENGNLSSRPAAFFDQAELDIAAIVKSRFPERK